MTGKQKTPLDLELNLFENSFASKDLLHAHTAKDTIATDASMPQISTRSTATSLASQHSLQIDRTSGLGGSSEMLEIKPREVMNRAGIQSINPQESGGKSPRGTEAQSRSSSSLGNNKHNLRILNFGSVNNDRLPGLTPPVFTPGGRRLPPIHLLPGLGMASPGTPGSNMWSSLLTATTGTATGQSADQHPGLYTQPSFPLYMRKSGLIPTESNLRSGLTPGLMGPNGFNFNIPDAMNNGQMTPGLQTLLGLVNNNPVDQQNLNVPPPTQATTSNSGYVIPPTAPPQNGQFQPALDTHVEQPPVELKENKSTNVEPAPVKKEAPAKTTTTKKRAQKSEDSGPKTKAQKTSKNTTANKVKGESKEEPKETSADDDGLDEEEKRKQFLERNRVAALKCRQRKKQQLNKMESELAFYSDGYRDLTAQVSQLRDQVMSLRAILISHKDCPSLLNSLGGYQQLQNVLAQADFFAHGGKNAEATYPPITAGIPAMLNTAPHPVKPAEPMVMNTQEQMGSMDHNVNGLGANGVVHDMHVHDNHNMNHGESVANHQNREQILYDPDLNMNRPYSLANGHPSGMEIHQQHKDNLRPVNSTSNLQHIKHENQMSGYDLRPIASMADLQHQNNNSGMIARQFQL